jgi:hypothetical protein
MKQWHGEENRPVPGIGKMERKGVHKLGRDTASVPY